MYRKDDFMITCPSIGELTKLKIGHNNKGPGSGWFLSKVVVDDTLMHRVYEFVCDRWLAEDEGLFAFIFFRTYFYLEDKLNKFF